MKTEAPLPNYNYRGARACVLLHETHMREFLTNWREAEAMGISLPESKDEAYQSLEHLLQHVLRCARGYMVWMCEMLSLPSPAIAAPPELSEISAKAESYLSHVLEGWRAPLAGISEDDSNKVYPSRWGVDYCIDAMLEHAVMHPIRHSFQLRELIDRAKQG